VRKHLFNSRQGAGLYNSYSKKENPYETTPSPLIALTQPAAIYESEAIGSDYPVLQEFVRYFHI